MSLNIAICSCTGIGLAIYGGYKYATANQKPAQNANNQKKISLGLLAAGIVTLVGSGVMHSGLPSFLNSNESDRVPTDGKNPIFDSAQNTSKALDDKIVNCPLESLKNILKEAGDESRISKVFRVLENNQGISCNNHLQWKDEFQGSTKYIYNIKSKDLNMPVIWGIDRSNRPFIAAKYICDQSEEGTVTIFQRHPHPKEDTIEMGGNFQSKECKLWPLDPGTFYFMDYLSSFLKDGKIVTKESRYLEAHTWSLVK